MRRTVSALLLLPIQLDSGEGVLRSQDVHGCSLFDACLSFALNLGLVGSVVHCTARFILIHYYICYK